MILCRTCRESSFFLVGARRSQPLEEKAPRREEWKSDRKLGLGDRRGRGETNLAADIHTPVATDLVKDGGALVRSSPAATNSTGQDGQRESGCFLGMIEMLTLPSRVFESDLHRRGNAAQAGEDCPCAPGLFLEGKKTVAPPGIDARRITTVCTK